MVTNTGTGSWDGPGKVLEEVRDQLLVELGTGFWISDMAGNVVEGGEGAGSNRCGIGVGTGVVLSASAEDDIS